MFQLKSWYARSHTQYAMYLNSRPWASMKIILRAGLPYLFLRSSVLTIPTASLMTSCPFRHVYNPTPCPSSTSCALSSRRLHSSSFLFMTA